MFDMLSFGELLVDFTMSGHSVSNMRLFEQNPGGAVANAACALSRLGGSAAYMGKVGADMHGSFLSSTLESAGVDISGVIVDEGVFTTLAFVSLSPNGEREFSFARKPGADTCFSAQELNTSLISNTKLLHIGSLSLTAEPSREATYEAVRQAKAAGALISYDPNYRASLWQSENMAMHYMRSLLPYADMIKLSDEETELLTGEKAPEAGAEALFNAGIRCVAVTLGKKGAYVRVKEGGAYVDTYEGPVADTTGAGDAFWGGFIYAFTMSKKPLGDISLNDAVSFAKMGNATATLCVAKRGGIPAMPALSDVEALLKAQG